MDLRAGSQAVSTVTSTTLLQGLSDPGNEEAWRAYIERYRPMIVRFARRLGVPEPDAEDVAQAALLAFTTAYRDGRYDREKGRLRSWLFGIVERQARNWRRRRPRELQAAQTGTEAGAVERVEAADELSQLWEEEWRHAVLRQCLEELRPSFEPRTMQAFERVALRGETVEAVAAELGLTPDAIYCGKLRVLKRLRALLPLMEEVW